MPQVNTFEAFWKTQAGSWPTLQAGIQSLRRSAVRSFSFDGITVKAQCIPSRLKSASAALDAESLATARCDLCPANLPVGQKRLPYRGRWLVLCNPAPIFEPHFVVNSSVHTPQRVTPAASVMTELVEDFGGRYTVFYNGPDAGASIPQHLHVQVVPAGALPFEQDLADALSGNGGDWIEWLHRSPVSVGIAERAWFSAVIAAGEDRKAVTQRIVDCIAAYGAAFPVKPEPRMNLFMSRSAGLRTAWFFPRARYRPSCFGFGPDDLLVSPGTVDMGGILMVPRPNDLERLTVSDIQNVYKEVTFMKEQHLHLKKRLLKIDE